MIALAEFALLMVLAASAGSSVLQRIGITPPSASERLVYAAPIGLGVIAYLILALGLLGLLYPLPVALSLAATGLLSFRGLLKLVPPKGHRQANLESVSPPTNRLWVPLAASAAMASLALIVLVGCFVPPAADEWDALSYHLAAPKVYLEHGRILYLPTDHHSNFPFTMQMLFLVGLLFNGFALANFIHFGTAILTAGAIAVIARKHFPLGTGWAACLVFASCPMVVWESGAAYVEIGFALFVLTSVGAALEFLRNRDSRWLLLSGSLMGFALSVKTLALIPLVLTIGLLAASRIPLRKAALFAGFALVIGSPFYLKSWIVTGNPVYPFGYRVFGGRDWSVELAETYASEHRAFGQSGTRTAVLEDAQGLRPPFEKPTLADRIRNLVQAPFDLVAVPRIFHNFNNPGIHAHLGFLVVSLPALLLFARKSSVFARLLAVFCASWFVIWSQTMQYARYLLPMVPLLGLAGGEAAVRAARGFRGLAPIIGLVIALQVGVTLVHFGSRVPARLSIAADSEAREKYLESSVNIYAAQQWINRNTKQDDGVILFEETRGFYLDRPYLWGNGPHSLYIPYHLFQNGSEMADWFLARGYRYALLNLQFSPAIRSDEDQRRMIQASAEGTEAALIISWYADEQRLASVRNQLRDRPHRFRDVYWRLLLGDAVSNGGAVLIHDASSRGAAVLEFRPAP